MLKFKLMKLSKVAFFTAFFVLLSTNLYGATNCNKRVFNISINSMVTIQEALDRLASDCRFSVVVTDNEAKRILQEAITSVNINSLTLREIFNLLLTDNNLNYKYSGNILKISALSSKTFKINYVTSVREGTAITKANVDSGPVEFGQNNEKTGGITDNSGSNADNRIVTVEKFNFWEKIKEELGAVLNNGTEIFVAPDPVVNSNAGLVTITGTPAQIQRASRYIKNMQDSLKRQVLLDVNIISVDLSNDYSTGVDWSKFEVGFGTYNKALDKFEPAPLLKFSSNYSHGNIGTSINGSTLTIQSPIQFNIAGMMNFLETKGKAKVVSSPKVMAMNNQQALITVGDNINYNLITKVDHKKDNGGDDGTSIEYKAYSTFIGVLLNILPQISDDNKIMLRINPSLSSFKYTEDERYVGERKIAPDTKQKKLSTVVQVNDGDTIILGGLIGQKKETTKNGIPVLSEIPLVGGLFKSKNDILQTTELIFVVTPHIVNSSSVGELKDSLKALGYSKSTYGNLQ